MSSSPVWLPTDERLDLFWRTSNEWDRRVGLNSYGGGRKKVLVTDQPLRREAGQGFPSPTPWFQIFSWKNISLKEGFLFFCPEHTLVWWNEDEIPQTCPCLTVWPHGDEGTISWVTRGMIIECWKWKASSQSLPFCSPFSASLILRVLPPPLALFWIRASLVSLLISSVMISCAVRITHNCGGEVGIYVNPDERS